MPSDAGGVGLRRDFLISAVAILPVLLLTAFLGLFQLGKKSFWLDETFSVLTAGSSWGRLWDVIVQHEANMALYYIALHPWLSLGADETTVRLLSLVFALGAVALLYVLGATLFGRIHGLVAALFLGTNPFFLEWARNGRGYTLAIFGVIASTYLFTLALQKSSWPRWTAYSLVSGVMLYSHFLAALVVLAHALTLPWVDARGGRGRAIAAFSGAALLASPLLVFVLTSDNGQIDWIAEPSPLSVVVLAFDFAGRSVSLFLALPLIAALSVIGARSLQKGGSGGYHRSLGVIPLLVSWLTAPAMISLAVSFVKPIFFSRYLILSLPAFALLAALGALAPRHRLLKFSLIAAITAACLLQISTLYRTGGRDHEDWRGATRHVLTHAHGTDGIIFYRPYVEIAFNYYANQMDTSALHPQRMFQYRGYGFTGTMVPASWDPIRTADNNRIWLVLSHNRRRLVETERLRNILEVRYDLAERRRFEKVVTELYIQAHRGEHGNVRGPSA